MQRDVSNAVVELYYAYRFSGDVFRRCNTGYGPIPLLYTIRYFTRSRRWAGSYDNKGREVGKKCDYAGKYQVL